MLQKATRTSLKTRSHTCSANVENRPPPPRNTLRFEQLEDRAVPAAISGLLFYDANVDGTQNYNESTASGVTVSVTPEGGPIQTGTTDTLGHFAFTGLNSGNHLVVFTAPSGYSVGGTMNVLLGTSNVSIAAGLVHNGVPPPAEPSTFVTMENVSVTFPALIESASLIPSSSAIAITAATLGSAVVNSDNSITYTPVAGFVGVATLSYSITDANNVSTIATASIRVVSSSVPIPLVNLIPPPVLDPATARGVYLLDLLKLEALRTKIIPLREGFDLLLTARTSALKAIKNAATPADRAAAIADYNRYQDDMIQLTGDLMGACADYDLQFHLVDMEAHLLNLLLTPAELTGLPPVPAYYGLNGTYWQYLYAWD